jgi:hypothetical protein
MIAKTILETERLLPREFVADDVEVFYRLGTDPAVTRYTGDCGFRTIEQARGPRFPSPGYLHRAQVRRLAAGILEHDLQGRCGPYPQRDRWGVRPPPQALQTACQRQGGGCCAAELAASHILMALSSLTLTMRWPSGLKAT